ANRRELDPELVLRASLLVTDDIPQAKTEAGEFIDLVNAGTLDWSRVRPLHEIVTGSVARDPGALTLFKSLRVGLEDVAVASIIYDRALVTGRVNPLRSGRIRCKNKVKGSGGKSMAFRPPSYDDIVNSKYAAAMPATTVLPQTETRNYFQAI